MSLLKGTKLAGAYDAIGAETTVRQCAAVLHALGGGTIASVVSAPETFKDVKIGRISSEDIVSESPKVAKEIWGKYIPAALKTGQFVPAPKPLVVGSGLENVQKGFDRQEGGRQCEEGCGRLVMTGWMNAHRLLGRYDGSTKRA